MADDNVLRATARVTLADPAGMLERLCDHFASHGSVTRRAGGARLDGPFGAVELDTEAGELRIAVASPGESYLFVVKSSVAEHLVEFADGRNRQAGLAGRRRQRDPHSLFP